MRIFLVPDKDRIIVGTIFLACIAASAFIIILDSWYIRAMILIPLFLTLLSLGSQIQYWTDKERDYYRGLE